MKKVSLKEFYLDSTSIATEVSKINNHLFKLGFLQKKIESISKSDSLYIVNYHLGVQFQKINLKVSSKYGIDDFLIQNKYKKTQNTITLEFNNIEKFLNQLTKYLNSLGDSFSKVALKNIHFKKNTAHALLLITKTKKRTIDKIIIKGYSNFPKAFSKILFNSRIKSTYNQDNLNAISSIIKSIPFVEEIKKPATLFTKDSTLIYIYLKKKKSNRFDGLIGFSNNNSKKGIDFEGNLTLHLKNSFNKGEELKLNWNSNPNIKHLSLSIYTPFVFKSAFSPKINFEMFSKDSSFINLKSTLDLNYYINSKHKISGIFSSEKSSDLLNNSNQTILDFNNYFYGLKYSYAKLTNITSSRNKFMFSINGLFGKRNSTTINDKQEKVILNTSYEYYLNKKNSIYIRNTSEVLFSSKHLNNELFRIGGSRSIRGFNEESILSTANTVFNLEYHFQTNKKSYLYSISDFAHTENKITNKNSKLYGFGVGYSLLSKNNLFKLSYVVGKTNNQPINLTNAVVHLEIISFF